MWISNTHLTLPHFKGITQLNSIPSLQTAGFQFEFLFLCLNFCFLCDWRNSGGETAFILSMLNTCQVLTKIMLICTAYCFAPLLLASWKHEHFTDHLLFNVKNNPLVPLQLPVYSTGKKKKKKCFSLNCDGLSLINFT